MVSSLDIGQISFNLLKNALASRQLGFLATGIAFYDILTRACAVYGQESGLRLKAFRFLEFFFFRLSFFSFSFLLLQSLTF